MCQLVAQRRPTAGDHLAAQQSGKHAIFLRNVFADGETRAFFAADENLVLLDQFANVLEANRRFVEFDLVFFGKRVDEIGGGDRFADSVLPAAGFNQVIEEQRNDVVGLEECAILVDNAEAIGIAIGRNADAQRRFRASCWRRSSSR